MEKTSFIQSIVENGRWGMHPPPGSALGCSFNLDQVKCGVVAACESFFSLDVHVPVVHM